jgi:hypothetical protein
LSTVQIGITLTGYPALFLARPLDSGSRNGSSGLGYPMGSQMPSAWDWSLLSARIPR